ncbi:phytochelatin synthase family protein [Aestuariispira ectoiniformans]|uniref:phytochelatin synthase family protein n=1 Tax=Aestuariispira ectoiniformans TaxID=2775080 RepID=UPI00223AEC1C|nr:phytochelatin synthase family protein [Aestuariispira ectoiniformans]
MISMTKRMTASIGAITLAAGLAFSTVAQAKDDLLYLIEPEGQDLFMHSEIQSDYFSLASYLEFEQVQTFCGPATMAAVLNSLGVERPKPQQLYPYALFTQDEIFTPENQAVKSYAMVDHEGLVLPQIATFLTNLGVTASYKHASDLSVDELREIIKAALSDKNKRLIVNYSRKPLGQIGDGHISPAAAYDADSDRVLILDVAKYKYPPVWLTVAELHEAMMLKDPSSNKTRGIVVVSR